VKKTWKTNYEVSKCLDISKTIVLTLESAIQKSQIKHNANSIFYPERLDEPKYKMRNIK